MTLTKGVAILILSCFMAAAVFPGLATADRGSMPFLYGAEIYEPAQNAIVAWNGQEELLILSTDLRASQPTKVLEVLPLPAEPKVGKGDNAVFRKMNALIAQNLFMSIGKGPGSRGQGAAEVTFHEKIGAHDITVVHILDSMYFEEWVNEYFSKHGFQRYRVSPVMMAVIGQYILDGYSWFVFDVVELGTALKSNDVIEYRFASDKLYYPMRISASDKGETDVRLITVTKNGISKYLGLPREEIRDAHYRVYAPVLDASKPAMPAAAAVARDLTGVHPEMAGMFGDADEVCIQTLRVRGELNGFNHDILAR